MYEIEPEEPKMVPPDKFKMTCAVCGSDKVGISDDTGYSDETGAWGSIDIVCNNEGCNNIYTLADN